MPDSIVDTYRCPLPLFKSGMSDEEKERVGNEVRESFLLCWRHFMADRTPRDYVKFDAEVLAKLSEAAEIMRGVTERARAGS